MQWVYTVTSSQRYEGSNLLRICSNYDKAFEYLQELVKGKNNEWEHRWVDDNFRVMPASRMRRHQDLDPENKYGTRWYYVDVEDDEHTYDIEAEPLY